VQKIILIFEIIFVVVAIDFHRDVLQLRFSSSSLSFLLATSDLQHQTSKGEVEEHYDA
jgi:hypothetical protein